MRAQPSPSWVPDREGESSTQGFQRLLLSYCRVPCSGLLFLFVSAAAYTLLLSCFPEGWTELLCLPQFPSCHTQPVATQGCDRGSLDLERNCLCPRGRPAALSQSVCAQGMDGA